MRGKLHPNNLNAKKLFPVRSKRAFLLCVFVLLIVVVVPTEASANFVGNVVADGILQVIGRLFAFIVSATMFLLNGVAFALLWVSVAFVRASTEFMFSASYTPLSNDFGTVAIAWGIVRDLANMSMIIALLGIGVGTILNLEIGGKKMGAHLLIPFFVVALLINFTPQITGMAIDLSNVLSKFFFDEVFGGVNAFINNNPFTNNLSNALSFAAADIADVIAGTAESMVAFVFNFTVAIILFALGLLLVVRVLAIQILVILSPLAFVGKIFGGKGKLDVFGQWWHQFFQWLILPIIFGFFLWLALLILIQGSNQCGDISSLGSYADSASDTFGSVVQSIVGGNKFCLLTTMLMSVITIFAGAAAAMKFSPMGASFIMNKAQGLHAKGISFAKKWGVAKPVGLATRPGVAAGRAAGGWAKDRAIEKGSSMARRPLSSWSRKLLNARTGTGLREKASQWGQDQQGIRGYAKRGAGKIVQGTGIAGDKVNRYTGGAAGKVGQGVRVAGGKSLQTAGKKLNQGALYLNKKEQEQLKNEKEKIATEQAQMEFWSSDQVRDVASNPLHSRTTRVAAALKLAEKGKNIDEPNQDIIRDLIEGEDADDITNAALVDGILESKNGADKLDLLYDKDTHGALEKKASRLEQVLQRVKEGQIQVVDQQQLPEQMAYDAIMGQSSPPTLTTQQIQSIRTDAHEARQQADEYKERMYKLDNITKASKDRKDGLSESLQNAFPNLGRSPEERKQWAETVEQGDLKNVHTGSLRDYLAREDSKHLVESMLASVHWNEESLAKELFKNIEPNKLTKEIFKKGVNPVMQKLATQHLSNPRQKGGIEALSEQLGKLDQNIVQGIKDSMKPEEWAKNVVAIRPQIGTQQERNHFASTATQQQIQNISTHGAQWLGTPAGRETWNTITSSPSFGKNIINNARKNNPKVAEALEQAIINSIERSDSLNENEVARAVGGEFNHGNIRAILRTPSMGARVSSVLRERESGFREAHKGLKSDIKETQHALNDVKKMLAEEENQLDLINNHYGNSLRKYQDTARDLKERRKEIENYRSRRQQVPQILIRQVSNLEKQLEDINTARDSLLQIRKRREDAAVKLRESEKEKSQLLHNLKEGVNSLQEYERRFQSSQRQRRGGGQGGQGGQGGDRGNRDNRGNRN